MLGGEDEEELLQNHSPDGYGDADERNRNSKNQKSRRRVNRTGEVKKTHLVIITISPEDTHKKKYPTHRPKLRPASIRSRNKRTKLVELHASTFSWLALGYFRSAEERKKIGN